MSICAFCARSPWPNRGDAVPSSMNEPRPGKSSAPGRILSQAVEADAPAGISGNIVNMSRKASVVIEEDEYGFYAWCPELKGCQSQGATLDEALANIKEAVELYLETLPLRDPIFC